MLTWLMVKIKYHFHVTCMATYVASFCPISIEILDWQILRRCWFFFVLFQLTPKYKFSWYYFFYQLKIKNKSSCKKKKKTQYLIKNNQTKIVETKQTIRWVFFFKLLFRLDLVASAQIGNYRVQTHDPNLDSWVGYGTYYVPVRLSSFILCFRSLSF